MAQVKPKETGILGFALFCLIMVALFGGQGGGKHEAPKNPAPTKGMGNVQLTIYVEMERDKATVTWDVGHGLVTRVGHHPSEQWDDVAQPNQRVSVTISQFHLGESGVLFIQVIQNNNGRVLCQANNAHNRRAGGACTGLVTI